MRRKRTRRHLRRRKGRNWHLWAAKMWPVALSLTTIASLTFLGFNIHQYLLRTSGWKLAEVKIVGCLNSKEAELLELAGLDLGRDIWRLNLKELGQRFLQHPWVEKVQVRRDWCRQALIIEVQERIPRALILLDDLYLVDSQGKIFKKIRPGERIDLPVLTGLGVQEVKAQDEQAKRLLKQALDLIDLLAERSLFNHHNVSEIHLHKQKGLIVYTLEKGLPIYVGWGDFTEKLNRLEKVLADVQKKAEEVEYIDLNYPRQVIVRMKERQNWPSGRNRQFAGGLGQG